MSSTSTIRTGEPSSIRAAAPLILDLAEPRVERLHDELALAEEAVDDQAVQIGRSADHDHGQLVVVMDDLVAAQNLMRGDEADLLAVEGEMLAAFERLHLARRAA